MSQYVIGIDLGTTNSALAYAPLAEPSPVSLFQIPQLANAGELARAGANALVAGSAVFKGGASAYRGNIEAIRTAAKLARGEAA